MNRSATEIKLHYYQKSLIKKLTLSNIGKRFNSLQIKGMESEHMNYHLKKLVEVGYIEKSNDLYLLTNRGKDYSNLMDDGMTTTEKQPKTSVIIWGVRKNEKGEVEQLVNRRLRQPYFGKVGRITGKVLFGETLEDAAKRELYEETGLTAKSFVLEEIYRKMRRREDDVFVQDVIFYIFFVTGFSGKLIKKTSYQENFWVTKKDLREADRYDLYDDFKLDFRVKPKPLKFIENVDLAEGF